MPDGPRLQDLRGKSVRVLCGPCGKNRTYPTAHLCRVLGPETAVSDALLRITRRCPYQRRVGSRRPNGLGSHCQAGIELEAADAQAEGPDLGVSGAGFLRPLSFPPYRVETWDKGGSLTGELALITDLVLANGVFELARVQHPDGRVTLRQGGRLMDRWDRTT